MLSRWGMSAINVQWKDLYKKRHVEELERGITGGQHTSLEQAMRRARHRSMFFYVSVDVQVYG